MRIRGILLMGVFLFTACVDEVIQPEEGIFEIDRSIIEIDRISRELYLQTAVSHSGGIKNIDSVFIQLSLLNDGFYENYGIFTLYDNGENGDLIAANGVYTLLTDTDSLTVLEVSPQIIDVDMEPRFDLLMDNYDSLDVAVTISGKTIKAQTYATDTAGNTIYSIEILNLVNSHVEILTNSDDMFKDDPATITCDRKWELTNEGLQSYYSMIENEQVGNSSNYKFSTKIPFRPISACGGTGLAYFQFVLYDWDTGDTASVNDTLMVVGCGDGECFNSYEDHLTCPGDCP